MLVSSSLAIVVVVFTLFVISIVYSLLLRRRKGSVKERRHKRYRKEAKRIYDRLNSAKDYNEAQMLGYLRKINPYVFEELVLYAFREKGCTVEKRSSYSGDGGEDGRVKKDGKTYLIQCKRYRSHIDASHVEAFGELCEARNKSGFFVHTGRTGKRSWMGVWQSGRIEMISGKKLIQLLNKTQD